MARSRLEFAAMESSPSSSATPMVRVRVASDTWLVPRLVLCHRSVRFKSLLDQNRNHVPRIDLDFSDVDNDVKDLFYSWIIHGRLQSDGLDPASEQDCNKRFCSLMALALVAERYKIPELSNCTIDHLHTFFTEARSLPSLCLSSKLALRFRSGSKVYAFIVEIFAHRGDIAHRDYFARGMSARFGHDVLAKVSGLLIRHQGNTIDPVSMHKLDRCQFHQFPHCDQLKSHVLQLLTPGILPTTPPSQQTVPTFPCPPVPLRPPPPTPPPEDLSRKDSVRAHATRERKLSGEETTAELRNSPTQMARRTRSSTMHATNSSLQPPSVPAVPPPQNLSLRGAVSNPGFRDLPPQQPPPSKPLPPTPSFIPVHEPIQSSKQASTDARPTTAPSETKSNGPPQLQPLPRISRLWTWMPPLEAEPPPRAQTFPMARKTVSKTPEPDQPSTTSTSLSPITKPFKATKAPPEHVKSSEALAQPEMEVRKRSGTMANPDSRTFDPKLLLPTTDGAHRSTASVDVFDAWYEQELHSEKLECKLGSQASSMLSGPKSAKDILPVRSMKQIRQMRFRNRSRGNLLMSRLKWNKC